MAVIQAMLHRIYLHIIHGYLNYWLSLVVIGWQAALNFILINLAENQSYCWCNYGGVK